MKTKLVFMLMLICSVILFSWFVISDTNKVNDYQDKIALSRSGGTTRSSIDFEVDGSTDHKTNITVSVMNFTGTVVVQIVGGRTSAQYYFNVNEMGYEVISIGTLRAGTYTIRILVGDVVYEGTFVKETVGR